MRWSAGRASCVGGARCATAKHLGGKRRAATSLVSDTPGGICIGALIAPLHRRRGAGRVALALMMESAIVTSKLDPKTVPQTEAAQE